MKGFALLEILVALLVLSLGLIGIAGMQLSALQQSQDSYWQSVATTQLASLFERLRVNQSKSARAQELTLWNGINARLLPHGIGGYHCDDDWCSAFVQWKTKQVQSVSLTADL